MNYIGEILQHIGKLLKWWVIILPWENGIRVRLGKTQKVLSGGIYLKIPYLDFVYLQTTRLTTAHLPLQTIGTLDKKNVSVASVIGYKMFDIKKIYNTINSPKDAIINIVQSEIAIFISSKTEGVNIIDLEKHVKIKVNECGYGIECVYVKIVGYSVVRTYRLLQDHHWAHCENIN